MTIMTIVRDKTGACINIGPWDEAAAGQPMPEEAYEDQADVINGWDGGLYLADDPRRLGGDNEITA